MHFVSVSARQNAPVQLASLASRAASFINAGFVAAGHEVQLVASGNGVELNDLAVVARQRLQIATGNHRVESLAETAAKWAGGGGPRATPAPGDYTPPFALAALDRRMDSVTVVTDFVGLSQVYYFIGDGVAAVSSSALALARLFGCPVAPEALFGVACIGSMIAQDTAFAGVHKLPPGVTATLSRGQLRLDHAPQPAADGDGSPAAGAEVLRKIISELAQSFPEARCDLSGGLDSRLVLAAMPRPVRANHEAMTIGAPGSGDARIARIIAAREGLRHGVVDGDALVTPDAFTTRLRHAAVECQFSLNPLDRVMIDVLNRQLPQGGRFSGLNGETMRGFCYPGQQLDGTASAARARRLVDWRLISNDAVDPDLFDARWYADQRRAVTARLTAFILDLPGDSWGAQLDNLYLGLRMQRWAGTDASTATDHRQILAPFFDPAFIAFARAASPRAKRGSRLACAILTELDRDLAAIPLDSGLVPAQLARPTLRTRHADWQRTITKVQRKLRQRLRRTPMTSQRSSRAMDLFRESGGPANFDVTPLFQWGVFNPAKLVAFTDGSWRPDSATLGFLLNCTLLADELAATRESAWPNDLWPRHTPETAARLALRSN